MPKLKTKSGAKKRFSLTATGKVRANQAGKRHGMIKRTNKQIRNKRGTRILNPQDAKVVKQFLPYG
jgi:large subunit ribosomal protein L35